MVVQDLIIHTDNVCFHKQKYYAVSTKKAYLAELPKGYAGQFGPGIKSLIVAMYFGMGTSEPKIGEFLENMGVQISEGEVSNLLIKDQAAFHAEIQIKENSLHYSVKSGLQLTSHHIGI